MKSFIFACAVLIAGINAVPQDAVLSSNTRLVTDAIASAIEDFSQKIKDEGLDPLLIEREYISYALPVPIIFDAEAKFENVESNGLSNIVINRLNYGILSSRLSFDISLPYIEGSVENAAGQAMFFGKLYEVQGSGKVSIRQIRVVGNVRVNVGIISGISISSISLDLTLGGTESNVSLVAFGYDISAYVNQFIGTIIPTTISDFRSEINELLEIVVLDILNDLL